MTPSGLAQHRPRRASRQPHPWRSPNPSQPGPPSSCRSDQRNDATGPTERQERQQLRSESECEPTTPPSANANAPTAEPKPTPEECATTQPKARAQHPTTPTAATRESHHPSRSPAAQSVSSPDDQTGQSSDQPSDQSGYEHHQKPCESHSSAASRCVRNSPPASR